MASVLLDISSNRNAAAVGRVRMISAKRWWEQEKTLTWQVARRQDGGGLAMGATVVKPKPSVFRNKLLGAESVQQNMGCKSGSNQSLHRSLCIIQEQMWGLMFCVGQFLLEDEVEASKLQCRWIMTAGELCCICKSPSYIKGTSEQTMHCSPPCSGELTRTS
ncbi:hypothetical protein Q9966_005955 [Columba livia]|nr:hypothetical protein Q9966_005955 [Columba livia]